MIERIENQKGLVKASWTTDGDDPSIVLPFKIIGLGWNRWMTNSWPIINIIYNENTLTESENCKFKDFLYHSFHDESSVKILKLNSNEPRIIKNYVVLGEINGKTVQYESRIDLGYSLSEIQDIVEKLSDDNIIKEEVEQTDKTLDLVKNMINEFFDEVSFIEIKKWNKKPMIVVYYDLPYDYHDTHTSYKDIDFAGKIQKEVYSFFGVELTPYWLSDLDNKAKYMLDVISLKYDTNGNVLNK
jgi:DNA-binding transcriptional MerR regulator